MSRKASDGGVSSKKCATNVTSDEKKRDVHHKDGKKSVTQQNASGTKQNSFISPYLPIAREEVLLALGTGDTRPWEERLIQFARARLSEMSATSIAARTLINKLELSDVDQHGRPMKSKDGNSIWPSWPWTTPVHEETDERVIFLSFTGDRFHLLMELLQFAVWFNNDPAPTNPSQYSAYISWNDELLQILSNLLTFHGTVPLVGCFVSVLLYSYVEALVRCRNTAAPPLSHDIYADQYEELRKERNISDEFVKDLWAQEEMQLHNASPQTHWETHAAILRGPLFISLITRLAQLYYPLWRTLHDEMSRESSAMFRRSLTVYTHCVPMPVFPNADAAAGHLRALATPMSDNRGTEKVSNTESQLSWSSSLGNTIRGSISATATSASTAGGGGGGRQGMAGLPTHKGTFVPYVFSRQTVLNMDADLQVRLKVNDKTPSLSGGSHAVTESDIPISSEYLDEIVICIVLSDTGRLALLHDVMEPVPLPRALQGMDNNNGASFEFMRRVRRSGGYSTPGLMNSGAKILLAVDKEWRKQSKSMGEDDLLTDRSTDSVKLIGNHQWMAHVVREVLEIISRSCCFPLDFSQQQQHHHHQEQQHPQQCRWVYGLQDYYYINFFLSCCCVTSSCLSASILPFTVQLTQLALSDAVLSGDSNPDQLMKHMEESEVHALAVRTLCVTACRFLRLGYELGCVVSNNEHVRWLSIVLRRHVKLWVRNLRQIALLMTVQGRTSAGKEINSNSTATVNDISNTSVWRALYWRTTAIMECLYVLRDLFRYASTWSVVNDTTMFRTILAELGEALCMVCWIDMRAEGQGMIPAVVNPAVPLSPFPVMADLERRFYLGAMLVFVLCATADTLLAFHSWMDIRGTFFSDDEDEDEDDEDDDDEEDNSKKNNAHINNTKENSGVSRMNPRRQNSQKNIPQTGLGKGCDEIMRWIYDMYFCVLLPSGSRIHQSIALCTPERAMVPVVQRLNGILITNSMLHEEVQCTGPDRFFRNAQSPVRSSSSAAAAASSSSSLITAILHTSSDVMNIITITQRAIMKYIARQDRDGEFPVMECSDMLLRICEHMTLYAPWASWTSTTPSVPQVDICTAPIPLKLDTRASDVKQPRGTGHARCGEEAFTPRSASSSFSFSSSASYSSSSSSSSSSSDSVPPVNTHEPSSAGTRHSSSTRFGSAVNAMQTHVPFGPLPPPLYEGHFVIYVANKLLRSLSLENITPQMQTSLSHKKEESSLLYILLHRVRALLFGLVKSLFRAADAAVYQRGVLQEQLRRGQFEKPAQPSVIITRRGEDTAKSSFLPSFLYNFTPPWSSSATTEDDAVRELRMNLEAIESYIEYHNALFCESVTYLASAIGSTQRAHWNDDSCANVESHEAISECCGSVLRLLSQQCLDALVPDGAVPISFQLAPLQLHCAATAATAATAGSPSLRVTHTRDVVTGYDISSMSAALSLWWPFGDLHSVRDWESAITNVSRMQCTALIRVMAVVASLTRTQISATAFAPLPTESSLSLRPLLPQETQTQESIWAVLFVLHPSTLSIGNWRKMAFSIQVMRLAEPYVEATMAPCWVCDMRSMRNVKNTSQGERGIPEELCFACGKSIDCGLCIRSYVEAGMPYLNKTRHDILIRRVTTVEERKSLFAIVLLFRRVFVRTGIHAMSAQEGSLHSRYRLSQSTRRHMERRLLLHVAAFAFGVRPLQNAEELLR